MAQIRNRRSGVEDRWRKADGTPSNSDGKGNRWRARYVDEQGREHAKGFTRKVDAQRWLDEVTAAVVTGQYVDPKAGQVTFRDYAERWREMQVQRPSSRAHVETMLRRHAYPALGDRRLSSILPSDVQAWVKGLDDLAPATIGVVHGIVSTIMKSAIRDRRIVANPCDGSKLPKVERKQVVPLTTEQVEALREALPRQLQALVTLAAGTGMRQGECFGLTVDRVKFLERTATVDRQLVTLPKQPPTFGPPKTRASNRTIPLPQVVVDALAVHLAAFPAAPDGLDVHALGKADHPASVRPQMALSSRDGGTADRDRVSRAPPLLRQSADPAWGEREDGSGASRSRQRGRDAGHLQPPVARFRRPDARRGRFGAGNDFANNTSNPTLRQETRSYARRQTRDNRRGSNSCLTRTIQWSQSCSTSARSTTVTRRQWQQRAPIQCKSLTACHPMCGKGRQPPKIGGRTCLPKASTLVLRVTTSHSTSHGTSTSMVRAPMSSPPRP